MSHARSEGTWRHDPSMSVDDDMTYKVYKIPNDIPKIVTTQCAVVDFKDTVKDLT